MVSIRINWKLCSERAQHSGYICKKNNLFCIIGFNPISSPGGNFISSIQDESPEFFGPWRWGSVLGAVNIVQHLLRAVLAGLRSPVGKVSEVPSWHPEHAPASHLAPPASLLLRWVGSWCFCTVTWNAWLPRETIWPRHPFLCLVGCREPQGPPLTLPRKEHKNPSVLGFPNDVEFP